MFCRKGLILTILSLLLVCTLTAATNPNSSTTIQKMNQMPLSFTKNMGQWDDRVLFRANAGGATMWFTKEGVTYQFTRRIDRDTNALSGHPRADGDPGSVGVAPRGYPSEGNHMGLPLQNPDDRDSVEQLVLTAKFLGANPNPEVIAEGQMEYKCNYFLGNDPANWHTDVPNYEAITLIDIYPGIDLKYSGAGNGQTKYEFIAAPGTDIAQIKVAYEGAEETSIDADGRLIVRTRWGDMIAAIKTPTDGVLSGAASFSQLSKHTLGFTANGQSLTQLNSVALQLSYSTYLGRGGTDEGYGIAVDGSGNAYVTGTTNSSNFPTLNPYQTDPGGGSDAFMTKMNVTGQVLIYSTYLGGAGDDRGNGIAVDGSDFIYVTGSTNSSNFPAVSPYQLDQGGDDAFVAKFFSNGTLLYSTYLGGGSGDYGNGIAVDGDYNTYVTGYTYSSDFPTTLDPYQASLKGGYYADAFVTKLNEAGYELLYSTYLGGEYEDHGHGIAVDGSGYAYVTGVTGSADFPTFVPVQSTFQGGTWDAFVTRLNRTGQVLIYSTYLGGGGADWGADIAVDGSDYAYVTGTTESSNFPTTSNTYQQTHQGGDDAFVTKLPIEGGQVLIYSTYLGGGNDDLGYGIAVDSGGYAYVTGLTVSSDFPTVNPYQDTYQGVNYDAFVTKLRISGKGLIYSTYLCGKAGDEGRGIAVDGDGNTYVTGITASLDFPTTSYPYQQTNNGGNDVFVTKFGTFPPYLCGDPNGSNNVNISDAVFLISYIFSGGPAPNPLVSGDANCSGSVNISDVVYLIAYIFSGGPVPCAGCK